MLWTVKARQKIEDRRQQDAKQNGRGNGKIESHIPFFDENISRQSPNFDKLHEKTNQKDNSTYNHQCFR